MTSTLNSAEVAVLLLVVAFAVSGGIATVAGVIMARERQQWQIKFEAQATKIVEQARMIETLTQKVDNLQEVIATLYPDLAARLAELSRAGVNITGERVSVGQGVIGGSQVGA